MSAFSIYIYLYYIHLHTNVYSIVVIEFTPLIAEDIRIHKHKIYLYNIAGSFAHTHTNPHTHTHTHTNTPREETLTEQWGSIQQWIWIWCTTGARMAALILVTSNIFAIFFIHIMLLLSCCCCYYVVVAAICYATRIFVYILFLIFFSLAGVGTISVELVCIHSPPWRVYANNETKKVLPLLHGLVVKKRLQQPQKPTRTALTHKIDTGVFLWLLLR